MTMALDQAIYYHDRRQFMDRQARLDAAIALGEWGLFSARQIGAIVGLDWWLAHAKATKTDRTGGRFNPADLPALKALAGLRARGEVDIEATAAAVAHGTSTRMASRLTGVSESTIKRHVERVRKQREEQS